MRKICGTVGEAGERKEGEFGLDHCFDSETEVRDTKQVVMIARTYVQPSQT